MATSEVFTRLICLFEDYTIRRCWPQDSGQLPALSVLPSLVFDLDGEKARAILVAPRSDGRILAEPRKFEKVYLSVNMSSTVQEEVGYSMYRRGKNWVPCARSAIPELREGGKECVETIWNVQPDQFTDLLWGLIRWPIKQASFQKLWFVVSSDDHKQMVKAAFETIAQNQSSATVLQGAEVLSCPEHLRGFALLDDPRDSRKRVN